MSFSYRPNTNLVVIYVKAKSMSTLFPAEEWQRKYHFIYTFKVHLFQGISNIFYMKNSG